MTGGSKGQVKQFGVSERECYKCDAEEHHKAGDEVACAGWYDQPDDEQGEAEPAER
jgi:hypothetical protein